MQNYTLTHLSNAELLQSLAGLVTRDRLTTAMLLAHIAEVDARKLCVPAGYSSMHAYCVDELHFSEDAASRRIQAARAGRQFPGLFDALAGGRLHLTGVCLIAPHLTPDNADELMEAVCHRRRSEIEELLARRFPTPETPPSLRAVTPIWEIPENGASYVVDTTSGENGTCNVSAPARIEGAVLDTEVPPPSEHFLVQVRIPKSTHDKLRYAQSLLSHAVPTGDLAQVIDRALDALIARVERRKFASLQPRQRSERQSIDPSSTTVRSSNEGGRRYVQAAVRRAVWERDHGQCTFVSANGTRCKARRFLEFDHADPVARGGKATVETVRLRCRTHNQYEAERVFGSSFMKEKRLMARLAAGEKRMRAKAEERDRAAAKQDVVTALRGLGCRAAEARRAAEFSETIQDAPLEERIRTALRFLGNVSVPNPTPVPGPTRVPNPSPIPRPSQVPNPSPVPGPSRVPAPSPIPGPSRVPGPTPVPGPTRVPSASPIPRPTRVPNPSPIPRPSRVPSPAEVT